MSKHRKVVRRELAAMQRGRCFYCGRRMTMSGPLAVTLDHVICLAAGGDNGRDNLVAACRECNEFKSRTVDSFLVDSKRNDTI